MIIVKELTTTAKVKDNDLKDGHKFMLDYSAVYKYEMPYIDPFVVTHFFTNGTVTKQ